MAFFKTVNMEIFIIRRSVMSKFGIQYSGKSFKTWQPLTSQDVTDTTMIQEILSKFQQGYSERDLSKVNSFTEELFLNSNDISVLGTATAELFFGFDEVKRLIHDDWEGWGDLEIDCENASISIDQNVAWFSTSGTVTYRFEHTKERYDRYVHLMKTFAEDKELTPKQRITLINWVLTLNFHQRDGQVREYFWPLGLSGVLIKEGEAWKMIHLHFSMMNSNFPDERLEHSKEYVDHYKEQMELIKKSNQHKLPKDISEFLHNFGHEFQDKNQISETLIHQYFHEQHMPYIIGPDICWYEGIVDIKEFFINSDMNYLSLDLENAFASQLGSITSITIMGTVKQKFEESELIQRSLEELDLVFVSDLSSQDKLFKIHRSIASVLKECASGENSTYPIRMTAVISNNEDRLKFNSIHFSFPFYWIFEGKLDSR